jgi:hypothetical protein
MLDSLELEATQAEAIVAVGIALEAYSDEMPDTKAGKVEAAHEIVAFAIDACVSDGVYPGTDDEEISEEAIEQVQDILALAGVKINMPTSDKIKYGDPVTGKKMEKILAKYEVEIDGSDDDDDDDADDEDTPFDIDEYFEDGEYSELTAASKLKLIKGLDPEDEDELEVLLAVKEWEETQDKPASRVLDYLADIIEEDDDASDDDDDDDADDEPEAEADEGSDEEYTEDELMEMDREELFQVAEDFGVETPQRLTGPGKKKLVKQILEAQDDADDDDDADDGEPEEPWDEYDDYSLADTKEIINDDERTVEELELILAYEEANKNRTSLVKLINSRIEELSEDDDDDDEGETEEEEKPRRRRGAAKAAKEEEEPEEEEDEKPKRGRKSKAAKADEEFDPDEDDVRAMLPVGLGRVFTKSKLDYAEKTIAEFGLASPGAYEGDMPELPSDIASVDHADLSNLLMEFQKALSTARWQQSSSYIWANTYEEIADYCENVVLLNTDESNDTKRKAAARTDDKVVFFRAKQKENYNEYVRWRDLANTIDGKVKVVSRIGGFVSDEEEATERKAVKPSTRGTAKGASKARPVRRKG